MKTEKISEILEKATESALWSLMGEVAEKIVRLIETGAGADADEVRFWYTIYNMLRAEIDSRLESAQ